MRREALKLLWDMQNAADSVVEFLAGKTFEDYRQSKLLRSGVERQLFIIGEALSQLSRFDEPLADSFQDRHQIVGFRNRLAHGYSDLIDERVYDIALNDIPALSKHIQHLLNS